MSLIEFGNSGTGGAQVAPFPTGTAGAPTGGPYVAGQEAYDTSNRVWICMLGGSPGTWSLASTVAGGGAVASVFGRAGAVTAQTGDYTAAQVGAAGSPAGTAGSPLAATDPTTTNARTPTAHAATHAAGGSDPVTITEAQVTGLSADLAARATSAALTTETNRATAAEALLAPLASPALTGTPTAPTRTAGANNTGVATTAYTDAAVGVETTRATTAEGLKATDTLVVHLAAAETVSGVKTFSVSPVVPTPTTPTQAANKSYIDSMIPDGSGGKVTTLTQTWEQSDTLVQFLLSDTFVADSTDVIMEGTIVGNYEGFFHVSPMIFWGPGVAGNLWAGVMTSGGVPSPPTGVTTTFINDCTVSSGPGLGQTAPMTFRHRFTGLTIGQTVKWALCLSLISPGELVATSDDSNIAAAFPQGSTQMILMDAEQSSPHADTIGFVVGGTSITPFLMIPGPENYTDFVLPAITVPGSPVAIAGTHYTVFATPQLAIANLFSGMVQTMVADYGSASFGKLSTLTSAFALPRDVAWSPGNELIYVLDNNTNKVSSVNPTTGATVGTSATIGSGSTGIGSPLYSMSLSPNGTYLVVFSNESPEQFYIFTTGYSAGTTTTAFTAVATVTGGTQIATSGVNARPSWEPDNAHFWYPDYNAGTLVRVTAATGAKPNTVTVPLLSGSIQPKPTCVAVSSTGYSIMYGTDHGIGYADISAQATAMGYYGANMLNTNSGKVGDVKMSTAGYFYSLYVPATGSASVGDICAGWMRVRAGAGGSTIAPSPYAPGDPFGQAFWNEMAKVTVYGGH